MPKILQVIILFINLSVLLNFIINLFNLKSDNGTEFKNKLMVDMIKKWDGDCKLIYGRPRHPQSQGLIEQANGTIEKMIASAMEQYQTKEWTKLLPTIQWNLNTSKPTSTKIMPFEVFFNKKPNFGNMYI